MEQPRRALRDSRPLRWSLLALVVALAGTTLANDSPYTAMSPGPAPAVRVGQHRPTRLHFTTVEVRQLTWGEWLWRSLHGADDGRLVRPDAAARKASQSQAALEMEVSKDAAWAASGTLAGQPAAPQAVVTAVAPRSPAARAGVRAGDTVVSVDGAPTATVEQVREAVEGTGGKPVDVALRRRDRLRHVEVRPGRGDDDRWRLGVSLAAGARATGRPDVESTGVGGPSAGLVFALAYTQARTGSDLTGATVVAGTGTMDPTGHVGPVGGVAYKVVGAHRAGAKVFLAPTSEAREAAEAAPPGLRVVAVDDLASAVRWLCGHGGHGPACDAPGNDDGRG